jgi:hypothetical protein
MGLAYIHSTKGTQHSSIIETVAMRSLILTFRKQLMDKIFNDLIPLICGVIYLLLIKGVIQLPQERQMKFNEFMARRKTVMLPLTYALILFSVAMIIKDLFFS